MVIGDSVGCGLRFREMCKALPRRGILSCFGGIRGGGRMRSGVGGGRGAGRFGRAGMTSPRKSRDVEASACIPPTRSAPGGLNPGAPKKRNFGGWRRENVWGGWDCGALETFVGAGGGGSWLPY